eukprot:Em0001g1893a
MYKRLGGESDGGGVDVMLVTACVGTSTVAFTTRVKIVSFYVIVDGLSATLEDSTLQEKPLFNDRSSVPSLSKLVTARTLQRAWQSHLPKNTLLPTPPIPASVRRCGLPHTASVGSRFQSCRRPAIMLQNATQQGRWDHIAGTNIKTSILCSVMFGFKSPTASQDQRCHLTCNVLPLMAKSPLSNGSLARKDTRVPSEEVEVVSVLEMGSQELLQVEQLLGNTQEVVVSLARGGFGDSVTTAHKGTITTGRHMIDGLYIAIPFEREGSMATPLQSEGAMVAQVPSASAMTLRVCWFVPLEHCTPEIYTWCRSQLASLLRRARVICYNGQQLARTLLDHYQLASQSSEWIHWTFLDTLIGSWLLDPDHPPQTFSEALIRAGLGVTRSEAAGSNKRELLLLVPLMNNLHQMLQKEDLWELFLTVEVKLIPILAAMEVFGIQINCQKLFEFADALKAAGRTFSVNSTAQLRQLCKLNAAFIQGTISHVSENIQAFPKDGLDLGIVKEQYIIGKAQEQVTISVREIVQSRTGYTFLAADFRSIELRLIAHLSGDQRLLAMLASDATGVTDVFTHLTSEWLGIPLESAGSSDRERTKRVVYAVIYGVGKLLIQIHDELVFEVPDDEVQAISGMIKGVLENPLLPTAECLKVPLEVRLTAGKNWAAMSEVKGRTP